jgi:hypothetical protein
MTKSPILNLVALEIGRLVKGATNVLLVFVLFALFISCVNNTDYHNSQHLLFAV